MFKVGFISLCAVTVFGCALDTARLHPGDAGVSGPGPTGAETACDASATAALAPAKSLRIMTKQEGETTHFYVENDELCEVTVTFEMNPVHLKGNHEFPYTAVFPAGKVTEAFVLSPDAPGAKWEYSYTNYYKLGSNSAHHDESCLYQLPYASGSKFRVTQAYNGRFSHTGSNRYAVDWKMSEGTPVYAARGGMVVKVKDDSTTGGASMKFDCYNNYVLIRHDDGTLGHYCHLQKGGFCVSPGQTVRAGELIAHSGNTGFSSGPHLHFCVFKTKNGHERESIPVKFWTAGSQAATLLSGHSYKAAPGPTGAQPAVSQHAAYASKPPA
jgi:murein DD-endopeptidase MepM/ murein hydrolase activator NlpD